MTRPFDRAADRRGMTLIEVLIALTVFSVVIAGALSFMRAQNRGFRVGAANMGVVQNLRFAVQLLETELRTLGANVPDEQPALIYAGSDVIAISADYVTNQANDPFAVYFDPDAPTGSVTAPRLTQAFQIPTTAFNFPARDYLFGGINSPAEVLSFYFALDATTPRLDDYALYRQANDREPELISRNLLKTAGAEFFEYFELIIPPSAPQRVDPVPNAALPLIHTVPTHQDPADVLPFSRIDAIRAVRVSFTTTDGDVGADERQRSVSRVIWFPNAGLARKRTCGDEPILGVPLASALGVDAAGDPVVNLSWNQAVDEGGGEQDVARYVLWRREVGAPDWGDPFLSIPAGSATYLYADADVQGATNYEYQLAAQDCTPSLSSPVASAPVAVP